MTDVVLALNAGSSNIKFALFDAAGQHLRPVLRGVLEDQGREPRLIARDGAGRVLEDRRWPGDTPHAGMLGHTIDWIERHLGPDPLVAVGHRIVHGGRKFTAPVRLDDATIAAIARLIPLAPLHQPRSLEPIHTLRHLRPDMPQVGCFDTAFHRTLTPLVRRYAVPRRFEAEGIRKYGFHGLSYEYVAGCLSTLNPALPSKRVVVAHLGNGASLCAMRDGESLDTTMGFSALDGLVMGTRPGTLDPGVVTHLQRVHGLSAEDTERMLYHDCGLLGVSELSSDMRTLAHSDDPRAREAVELFTFRISRETAAMANTMGGLEALVFTGGIGEHDADVRAAVCQRLAWLGIDLDEAANQAGTLQITHPESRTAAYVIPTDEEMVIARQSVRVISDFPI